VDIKFVVTDSVGHDGLLIDPPKPAKLTIPIWYRDMQSTLEGGSKFGISLQSLHAPNSTVKGCSPFLDSLTAGYMYCAPLDIEVRKLEEGKLSYKWRSKDEFISLHNADQYPGLPSPVELDGNQVLKWASPFTISTPPGYSCLFTHPLNRHDLPFRTFSGVVDTDSYELPVQFPFQLIKDPDDILIIERGTPVCQIIPFKRESWKHTNIEEDSKVTSKKRFEHHARIVKSYKTRNWRKKSYE
jgi:hypothetical protein